MRHNLMSTEELIAAALNRAMVTNKERTEAYAKVEEALQTIPLTMPLPAWIPQDTLPSIPKRYTTPHHSMQARDDQLEQLIDNVI